MEIKIIFNPGQSTQVTFPSELGDKKELLYHILLDAFFCIQKYEASPIIPGKLIGFPGGKISDN